MIVYILDARYGRGEIVTDSILRCLDSAMDLFSKRRMVGDYRVGKTIGQGAFSKVKLGYHKLTGEKVSSLGS